MLHLIVMMYIAQHYLESIVILALNTILSRKIYILVKNKKPGLDKIVLYAGLVKESVINGHRYYWDLFKGECYEKE